MGLCGVGVVLLFSCGALSAPDSCSTSWGGRFSSSQGKLACEPGFLDYLLLSWTPVLGLLRRPAIPLGDCSPTSMRNYSSRWLCFFPFFSPSFFLLKSFPHYPTHLRYRWTTGWMYLCARVQDFYSSWECLYWALCPWEKFFLKLCGLLCFMAKGDS